MRTLSGCCLAVSMTVVLISGNLAGQSISRYTRSAGLDAEIEIVASERATFKIPRTVYGTFLEHIGNSIFGGVSAQLLDNPSLETYYASLETLEERLMKPGFRRSTRMGLPLPWQPLRWEDGWRYELRMGQAANSESYLYFMGLANREVGIRQSIHLPIHRERTYQGVLFASSAGGPVEVEVSLRRQNEPSVTLAATQVKVPQGEGWTKLSFQLLVPSGAVAPLQAVDFVVALKGEQRVSLDEIRLYPADAVEGLDPDMIKASKALNTPILRYGGNFTSGYHWEDGIGPLDRRPTRLNQAWGYPEPNDFGTDEFMTFCRLIGARPHICLNVGSGTAQEAGDWVEYCQGGPVTRQGARRAANGHPEPYPVAAWEMGNELWGDFQIGWHTPESHARRYREFYRTIRDLVPPETMLFATGGDVDFYQDWNGALINTVADELHYLSTHFVVGMQDVRNRSAGRDGVWAAGFAIPVGMNRALVPLKTQIDANPATRGRVKLAYTEWLFWAPDDAEAPRYDNLGGALIAGAWMNMLLHNADFIPVSNMTGLIDFAGVHKKRSRVFVTPQYCTLCLYSNYAGDVPVATHTRVAHYDVRGGIRRLPDIADVPYLDVLATVDSRSGTLTLFVASREWKQPIPATIRFKDLAPAVEATIHTLTGETMLARNDEANPDAIRPVTTSLELSGESLRCTFPACSLTVIAFKPR